MKKLNILYLGVSEPGSTSAQRAAAFVSLGHRVTAVENVPRRLNLLQKGENWLYRKGLGFMGHRSRFVNLEILKVASRGGFDLLWVDKGVYVTSGTLLALKSANPEIKIVGYSPDYMEARHNNSRWFLEHSRLYDLFVTTKSYAVDWHRSLGCKAVLFIDNAYDPATHRPVRVSRDRRKLLGGSIGFIGFYEASRGACVEFLVGHSVGVKVYGPTWQGKLESPRLEIVPRELTGLDYAAAIGAFDINLCFLRKMNLDVQTQRSIEIPACGAFMLAERTEEHMALFVEGKEAEFFGGHEELLEKCRYYAGHPKERKKIAAAGLRRCIRSKYDNASRLAGVLRFLYGKREGGSHG